MKLLHPEVDIVPGRPGQRPPVSPVPEGQPIPGSAVVRVANTTLQENAYTIRLRCEQPFWQEDWYTVISLPPDASRAENAPPAGKPDQRGPQDRWVKIYVPRGGVRDVLLRFNVPKRAESRAGRYSYVIEIETQIVGAAAGPRRSQRVRELPATAIVRPFYEWSLDLNPEQQRVGLRRPAGEFEVIVTNEGNDWLYCDLLLPRPKDMLLYAPTLRLAVPPPEPGEMLPAEIGRETRSGTQRAVPLQSVTRLKAWRGPVMPQPLPLTARRIDAPSVSPPPDDPSFISPTSVTADATSEIRQLPGDRNLLYCPPVPAKLTDFFSHSGSSIRGMILAVIGLFMAANLLVVVYEGVWHNNIQIEPLSTDVSAGQSLPIQGKWLQGATILLGDDPVDPKFSTKDPSRCSVIVPSDLDHKQVKLKAHRFVRFLPFLIPLLPAAESKSRVQIGSLPSEHEPLKGFVAPPSGRYTPGQRLDLMGVGLGNKDTVYLGGQPVTLISGTNTDIAVTIPKTAPPGPLSISVVAPDGTALLPDGTITIADKPDDPLQIAAKQAAQKAAVARAAQQQAEQQKVQAQQQAAAQAQQQKVLADQQKALVAQSQTVQTDQQKAQMEQQQKALAAQQRILAAQQKALTLQKQREIQAGLLAARQAALSANLAAKKAAADKAAADKAAHQQGTHPNLPIDNSAMQEVNALKIQYQKLKQLTDQESPAIDQERDTLQQTFAQLQTDKSRVDTRNAQSVADFNARLDQYRTRQSDFNARVQKQNANIQQLNNITQQLNQKGLSHAHGDF